SDGQWLELMVTACRQRGGDPAAASTEGERTIKVNGAEARYQIAPLPDGRYAVRFRVVYLLGDCNAWSTPWAAFATRQACVEHFIDRAGEHFSRGVTGAQEEVRRRMLRLIDGFTAEPEPVPVDAGRASRSSTRT